MVIEAPTRVFGPFVHNSRLRPRVLVVLTYGLRVYGAPHGSLLSSRHSGQRSWRHYGHSIANIIACHRLSPYDVRVLLRRDRVQARVFNLPVYFWSSVCLSWAGLGNTTAAAAGTSGASIWFSSLWYCYRWPVILRWETHFCWLVMAQHHRRTAAIVAAVPVVATTHYSSRH